MTLSSTPLDPETLSPGAESRMSHGAWLVLLAAFLGWMFDGLEQGIFPPIARPVLKQMLGSDPNLVLIWFATETKGKPLPA